MRRLYGMATALAVLFFVAAGCKQEVGTPPQPQMPSGDIANETAPSATTIRLAEHLNDATLSGSDAADVPPPAPTVWNFADGTAPDSATPESPTLGWTAIEGVADFGVVDGKLTGTVNADLPLLNVSLPADAVVEDELHSVEISMRSSGAGNVEFSVMNTAQPIIPMAKDGLWAMSTPLVAGDDLRTYTVRNTFKFGAPGMGGTNVRQIFMRFVNARDVTFEIESIRFIFQKEYLAGRKPGRGWEGLAEIFRDTVVARAPESFSWDVTLPPRAWLDLGTGVIDSQPLTFVVSVNDSGVDERVWSRTVTTPGRWEDASVDLSAYAGEPVTLTLSLESEKSGTLGYWGAPVIRSRIEKESRSTPHGVILIIADTLRRDHLNMYGYDRETAPTLARMADQGVLFMDCVSPATWTKVATPSIMTGLWPSAHTVKEFTDRLPSSAKTLAEVYQEAGYATVAMSAVPFTGRFSNMHQGFEQLHESSSITEEKPSKCAREYVDRLLPWLEEHRDTPFFVVLHVFDPHDPFEPRPPFNTWWADPALREQHEEHDREVRKHITDPLLRLFGMPTEAELVEAGVEPEEFVSYWLDWYDGAIRGFDTEVERLMQGLEALELADDTVVALISDHGEEFLEHGATFHGQTVYGELTNVPLMLWQPSLLPQGLKVERTVQSIDLMPTLLALTGVDAPPGIHGQSLLPLLRDGGDGWSERPAVMEKAAIINTSGPANRGLEAFGLIAGQWKLVHNTIRPNGEPEFELYDHNSDPLNLNDVAEAHPEIVAKLADELAAWHATVQQAKLAPDSVTQEGVSSEELEQLRSLGYLQ